MIAQAKTVGEIINVVSAGVLRPFIQVLFAAAAVVFFWGIVEFVASSENETKKTNGKRHITWGLIGLAIMFGVNGILWILIRFVSSIK